MLDSRTIAKEPPLFDILYPTKSSPFVVTVEIRLYSPPLPEKFNP